MTNEERLYLNQKVAEKLGIRNEKCYSHQDICWDHPHPMKDYAGSIADAFEILEHLSKTHFSVSVSHDSLRDLWQCAIENIKDPGQYATAETAPLAICKSFLAMEEK